MPGSHFRTGPAALGLVAVAALVGCDGHLVGTRDVELDYHAVAPPEDLRARVIERMHAADLAADIDVPASDLLRVVVDEANVEDVDELITWPGGLRVYVLDPDASIEPKHLDDLTARSDVGASGQVLRYFTGSPVALARAAHATPTEAGRRLVVDASSGAVPRTRVAKDPPLCDLRVGVASAAAEGARLHVALTEGARAALRAAATEHAGGLVAFVRDTSILAVAPIEDCFAGGALTLRLGSSPRAYARAELAAKLLGTPGLPRMVRTQVLRKPPSYTLAFAEVLLPLLLSLAWLAFVRRFDRARPEPLWLVLVTFALGGAMVVPVSLCEWRLAEASAYTNPQLMTFGGQLWAFPLALLAYSLTVGLVEEGATLFAAWSVARQRREFDEPVDGIVYASAAALGFAAFENVRYFAAGRVGGGLVVTRAFMSAPAHFLFASLWGYALGQRLVDSRRRVWPWFLASVLAHGAFDACLSFPATAHLAPLVNFALATVFVLLLRKALRHGPVAPSGPHRDPGVPGVFPQRDDARGALDAFPVGSRPVFAMFVLALHASAALVFVLGVYVEQTHDRIGPAFILASTVLVALVGTCAYGVSASLPLDVVLDDAGVTFAGAFVAWSALERVERQRGAGADAASRILLLGPNVRLAVGPVDVRSADNLVASLDARMSRAAREGASPVVEASSEP